jgi:putative flippase GtrA
LDQAQDYQAPAVLMRALRLPGIRRMGLDKRPREVVRFLKFAAVGGLGMVVDLTILYIMRTLVGLPLLIANTISFSTAVVSNFTWNRLWTFPESRQRPLIPQLAQFALVNIFGLAINSAVLWAVFNLVKNFLSDPLDYLFAKIVAIGVVLFWNYGINRLWTYKGID